MRFNLISLFPEFFDSPLSCGLMGKALESGVVEAACVNPRDFATDRHRSVDDRPYGGGPGMVMLLDPLARALQSLERPGRIVLLTPRGRPFDQAAARDLAGEQAVTLVCGRYEGVDARLNELFPVEEYSVGDFVLNGGEAAAVCVMEAVSRLVPGFMGHEQSGEEESFSAGLLEYPHYTRPEEYQGRRVPEVLLSGDHRRIAAWRRKQALALTLERRPDLLDAAELGHADMVHLFGQRRRRLGRNLYVALLHHPVRNKRGKTVAVSLTNLDLHDIARCSRANSLGGYYVATPLEDQRRLAGRLLAHWTEGAGAEAIPDRAEALARVRVVESLEEAVARVAERAGQAPRVVATSARPLKKRDMCSFGRVRRWLSDTPVLLVLGTGSGLTAEVLNKADAVLRPLRYMDGYNHFSVRTAAAVMVDRLLGDVY